MAFSFFIQHIFVQDLLCAKEHYIRSKKYSSEKDTEVPSWRFCYIGGKDIVEGIISPVPEFLQVNTLGLQLCGVIPR